MADRILYFPRGRVKRDPDWTPRQLPPALYARRDPTDRLSIAEIEDALGLPPRRPDPDEAA